MNKKVFSPYATYDFAKIEASKKNGKNAPKVTKTTGKNDLRGGNK